MDDRVMIRTLLLEIQELKRSPTEKDTVIDNLNKECVYLETRIKEFHHANNQLVIGIREGSWLRRTGAKLELKGKLSARLFEQNKEARELEPGDVSFLMG